MPSVQMYEHKTHTNPIFGIYFFSLNFLQLFLAFFTVAKILVARCAYDFCAFILCVWIFLAPKIMVSSFIYNNDEKVSASSSIH